MLFESMAISQNKIEQLLDFVENIDNSNIGSTIITDQIQGLLTNACQFTYIGNMIFCNYLKDFSNGLTNISLDQGYLYNSVMYFFIEKLSLSI